MFPRFVEEGLVGPSNCVNKKNVSFFMLVLYWSQDSSHLCCVVCLRVRVCVLFCFYLFSSCVSVFAAFERVFRPPSSADLSI
jgi:hypothetical protein